MAPPSSKNEELISAAWRQHPIEVRGLAWFLTCVTIACIILTSITVGLRIWTRAWIFRDSKIWGWDDSLGVLSYLTFIPSAVYMIFATRYGLGTRDAELTEQLRARAALYLGGWQMFYAVSATLVKAGIAVALLRLTTLRRYRYSIVGILGVPPLLTGGVIMHLLCTCRPLGAQWEGKLGSCTVQRLMAYSSYVFTAFTVILDWACAVIPYLLLRDLQLRKTVKLSLMALLAFGSLAGVCAMIRLPYLKYYIIVDDKLFYFSKIVLWSTIEIAIGIIAASLPPIRKLFSFYGTTYEGSYSEGRAGAVQTIGGTPFTNKDESVELKKLHFDRF
ncbi:hypothetical protein DL764_003439 [Monosporascus ibericus]|uniref:Rhodopsin domain-containing protein n=1 Tax=Monosporascus ibericus TaxID=155417 RepID=A0A4V1XBE6_9PEZI|nr:hypothetical protein DL764_003439 [Monosporascus ibericus]